MASDSDHSELIRRESKAAAVRKVSRSGKDDHYELTRANGSTVEVFLRRGRGTWSVWSGKEMLSNPETSVELALAVTHWNSIDVE
jgi:hypothetical protein